MGQLFLNFQDAALLLSHTRRDRPRQLRDGDSRIHREPSGRVTVGPHHQAGGTQPFEAFLQLRIGQLEFLLH